MPICYNCRYYIGGHKLGNCKLHPVHNEGWEFSLDADKLSCVDFEDKFARHNAIISIEGGNYWVIDIKGESDK